MTVYGYGTMRRVAAILIGTAMLPALTGCFHKKAQAIVLPKSTAPVALATPPDTDRQPLVEAPAVKVPPVPVAEAAAKPKRERRRPVVKPVVPAPVQVASVEPTVEANPIGALTAGGEASPRAQQEVTDMLAAIDKRLASLSAAKVKDQAAQISKVKNFERQAQDALKSGDAEGARTLATKAKLLLDDLEK